MKIYDSLFDSRTLAYSILQGAFDDLSTQFSKVDNKFHSVLRNYQKLCALTSSDSMYASSLNSLQLSIDSAYSDYLDKVERMRLHYKDWTTIYSAMNEQLDKYPYHLFSNLNKDTEAYYQYAIEQTELQLQLEKEAYEKFISRIKELKSDYKARIKAL